MDDELNHFVQLCCQIMFEECCKQNLSVNKLASKSFLTQSTLNNLFHRNSRNPKLKTLYSVSKVLDIPLSQIIQKAENKIKK